jgi:hypothetical protein
MSALSIQVPFPVFQDRDGQPLDNGYVWIGTANLNPITNPVVAYYDAVLTIPAVQPLRTLNGYISRAGTPAQIYVDGVNFSILVQDSKGSMVYNFPDGTGISPDSCGIVYDPPFTGSVPTTVCVKLAETISAKDFGAIGDGVTDNFTAFQNAVNSLVLTGGVIHVSGGPNNNQYLFKTQNGIQNPSIQIGSNIHIVMDDDVYLLSEGGVASGVNGYNETGSMQKALFVNSTPSTGNENISITGGTIKCTAASAIGQTHIAFQNVKNVRVQNITLLDTWSACRMQFSYCMDVLVSNVNIAFENMHLAPFSFEDGIRVGSGCFKVAIANCNIYSGDDCIAINNETSETQNMLTSVTPFTYSINGANIQEVVITNVTLKNEAGNALRIYKGPGLSTGTTSRVVMSNFTGRPKHATTNWSTAISLFDNSGITTDGISSITISNFNLDCSFLGTSGTGSPSAISIETTGVDISISNGSLGGVSVPYGIGLGARTTLDNVSISACVNDAIFITSDNSVVSNCYIENSGVFGIHIGATATNTMLIGNRIFNTTSSAIREESGAAFTTAIGNDVSFSPACSIAANATSIYQNNTGLNPGGTTAVSGTSSPQTITAGYSTEVITIFGGTVSNIAVNGVNTGATSGSFTLGPNKAVVVTYSSGPTMTRTVL